ncbi:MAG: hypothetical protein VKL59_20575 [Nostocaceae cyanobacterium]|nr:hypothetical protein [Nostocaceae cyanobacterium]
MLEKLVQAAIITFLLNLLAVFSPPGTIQSQSALPLSDRPVSVASIFNRFGH